MAIPIKISDDIDSSSSTVAASSKAIKTVYDMIQMSFTSMPVGSIYVQYSGQSTPADLFGGTWSNISSTYAGRFFRAEGGDAATFGSNQNGGVPEISGTFKWIQNVANSYAANGAFSLGTQINIPDANDGTTTGQEFTFYASNSNALYGAAEEVRPINSTIRIWKRTA